MPPATRALCSPIPVAPLTSILQHVPQQHAPKRGSSNGACVPVQALDRLHRLHLVSAVASALHGGGNDMLLEAGLELVQRELDSAQALALEGHQ